MPTRSLITVGIEMPDDFPIDAYEAIYTHVNSRLGPSEDAWKHWAAAWNAIAYRFLAATEHSELFTSSIMGRHGVSPQTRYVEERELFAFFFTGLSVLESFCFGIHGLAHHLDHTIFPMTSPRDLRAVTVEKTTSRFQRVYPGESLTSLLDNLTGDPAFGAWKDHRNILAHRGQPPRNMAASINISISSNTVAPPISSTQMGISLDAYTTERRRLWMVTHLSNLLTATVEWTTTHLWKK